MFFRNRAAAKKRSDAAYELMIAARAILGDGEAVVSVGQHDCGGAACCGVAQTVVLVMGAGRPTEAFKIERPLEAVTPADLAAALAPLLNRNDTKGT